MLFEYETVFFVALSYRRTTNFARLSSLCRKTAASTFLRRAFFFAAVASSR